MAANGPDQTRSIGNGMPSSSMQRRVDPLIGTVFADRYAILEVLGRGGMGVVYKARHELMDRMVAIKMMLPQLVSDDNSLARFQREARAASKLSHPNIIAIHDFGLTQDTGIAYLVMDYLEGHSLSEAIKQDGQLGVARTVDIFLQVCDALSHAHKQGVIHRDLKPGNIMLARTAETEDWVKVVDFGVAKLCMSENETDQQRLTTTGEIFGSPVYMSPEQCRGDQLDARSDIYALGCVIYETLTGKLPCLGKTAIETISKHISQVPPGFSAVRSDLYIPDWMEKLVFKALEKDPSKRQQSMQELYEELYAGVNNGARPPIQVKGPSSARIKAYSDPAPVVESPQNKRQAARPTTVAPSQEDNGRKQTLMVIAAIAVLFAITAGVVTFMLIRDNESQNGTKGAQQTIVDPSTNTATGDQTAGNGTDTGSATATSTDAGPSVVSETAGLIEDTKAQVKQDPRFKDMVGKFKNVGTIGDKIHDKFGDKIGKIKEMAASIKAKVHQHAASHSASADTSPAPTRHSRIDNDYHGFARRFENEGAPVDLQTKPFGSN